MEFECTAAATADVPLEGLLSGMLDTAIVIALMQASRVTRAWTDTNGGDERAIDEPATARAFARHLGTSYVERRLGAGGALQLIPRMAAMHEERLADSSRLLTCMVMQLPRRPDPAVQSGDREDELFGGTIGTFPRPESGAGCEDCRSLSGGSGTLQRNHRRFASPKVSIE